MARNEFIVASMLYQASYTAVSAVRFIGESTGTIEDADPLCGDALAA